jgi:hypothetical protein
MDAAGIVESIEDAELLSEWTCDQANFRSLLQSSLEP